MLQELHVPNKGIRRVEVAAFCGLSRFSLLNMENNELTSAPPLCPVKCVLKFLVLGNNKISTISKNYLRGFKSLKTLYLDNNNIILLPDITRVKQSVAVVSAVNNYVATLEAFQTFNIFKQLHHIDLGRNNIRSINFSLLRHMPKLTDLDLYSNKITHIDDFRSFYDRGIYLGGNPWHCGATLSWMGEEDMAFEKGLVCATPACLRDMPIADMSKLSKPLTQSGGYILLTQ